MNATKELIKYSPVLGALISVLLFGGAALASSWEWLTNPSNITFHGYEETYATSTHVVNTSKTYYEYRSFYYYTTTTSPKQWTPPGNWSAWTEVSTCRRQGDVEASTPVTDTCAHTVPLGRSHITANTTFWFRSTTNYGGCGTYTSTPDVTNCGDYKQAYSIMYPY